MKWLKRAGYALLALFVASIPAYWWLLVETRKADPGSSAIDIAEVRRLADSHAGEKPRLIRVETVAHLGAPKAFVVAGDGWQMEELPVSSYQLVYPDRIAVLDTAFDAEIGKSMYASNFDGAAYSRIRGALTRADLIFTTHEHPDHVSGLLAQPDIKKLLATTRLTREQVAELKAQLQTDTFKALQVPLDVFDGYRPLNYGRYQAIAPGVVLIKAPGHSPGSQMVYVRRADGVEFLFLGDVAWQMRNIEINREKPRLTSWMAGEDRSRVRGQLAALSRLHAAHPGLHMIPGHDAEVTDSFVKKGLLAKGF